jgi:hypothetical protein
MADCRILLLALLLASGAAQAQIYRWVDQNGNVQYSNSKPPKGVEARIVDPDAKAGPPAPDSAECYTIRCQGERMEERQRRRDADDARASAERAAAAPRQPRGLEFRNYIRIQRGMSEGELLTIAGEPDLRSEEGAAYAAPTTVQTGPNTSGAARVGMAVRTYTYLPTSADPFTTTITLVGGRVSEIERARKF